MLPASPTESGHFLITSLRGSAIVYTGCRTDDHLLVGDALTMSCSASRGCRNGDRVEREFVGATMLRPFSAPIAAVIAEYISLPVPATTRR